MILIDIHVPADSFEVCARTTHGQSTTIELNRQSLHRKCFKIQQFFFCKFYVYSKSANRKMVEHCSEKWFSFPFNRMD